jgi:hypothetical protein
MQYVDVILLGFDPVLTRIFGTDDSMTASVLGWFRYTRYTVDVINIAVNIYDFQQSMEGYIQQSNQLPRSP